MDRAQLQTYVSSDVIDPTAETVINAAPYDVGEGKSGGRAPDGQPDALVPSIKGRVVTAASLYLDAQRDTVGG
jgi:hypothetical protein